jgi:hypothetical protein
VRSQPNPAYRGRRRWELSPRGRLIWTVLLVAILIVLVLTERWIAMFAFIVLMTVAGIIEAIFRGDPPQ